MYSKSLEESGKEQEFAGASDAFQLPTDWSRDGRFLLYQTSGSALPGASIVLLDLAHQGKRIPLIGSSSQELGGVFSPNTSWVSFLSNETGQTEAYIQSFEADPQPHLSGERQRISSDGASLVRWRADGKEIYYLNGSNWVTAVSVNRLNGKLVIGSPQRLFHLQSVSSEGAVAPGFDVSADGQSFVIADPQPPHDAPFVVIQNWQKLVEP
jgi:Tol biopolymer transport system component